MRCAGTSNLGHKQASVLFGGCILRAILCENKALEESTDAYQTTWTAEIQAP